MELRQLRYFVGIVDAGSLTRAADHLHIAQPALTQQVSNLEAELGVKLLTRSVRGVQPTEAGLAFYRHAQHILRSCNDAASAARNAGNEVSGTVSVGFPSSVGAVIAVQLIGAARERLPGVQLQITDSSSVYLAEMLQQGRLDLAVLFNDQDVRGLTSRQLVVESLLLASQGDGRPSDGPLGTVSLAEVAGHELLLPIRPNQLRLRVDEAFAQIGMAPRILAEVSSMSVLAHAVVSGLAHTITSWPVIAMEIASGAILARRIVQPEITRTLTLCQPDVVATGPAVQAVHALLSELLLGAGAHAGWRPAATAP